MRLLLSCGTLFHLPLSFVFEIARDAGFDGVEVIVGRDAQTVAAEPLLDAMKAEGLPVPVLHAPFFMFPCPGFPRDEAGRLAATVELAKAVGAETVVQHVPIYQNGDFPAWFDANIERLSAGEGGVTVAVENMPVRAALFGSGVSRALFRFAGRTGAARRLLFPAIDQIPRPLAPFYTAPPERERTRPERLLALPRLTLDTGHMLLTGDDPVDFVRRAGARLAHVHLSDVVDGDDHRLPYSGDLPVAPLVAALRETGYAGCVTLEGHPACFGWGRARPDIVRTLAPLVARLREAWG